MDQKLLSVAIFIMLVTNNHAAISAAMSTRQSSFYPLIRYCQQGDLEWVTSSIKASDGYWIDNFS